MTMLETDGPYEGATCAVTHASGFSHANNSQLAQYAANVAFYRLGLGLAWVRVRVGFG